MQATSPWKPRGRVQQESPTSENSGEFGAQDLDGDLAVVFEILGEVDRGHAAGTQLALDPIPIRKR